MHDPCRTKQSKRTILAVALTIMTLAAGGCGPATITATARSEPTAPPTPTVEQTEAGQAAATRDPALDASITEKDNGATFTYRVTQRFSVALDEQNHPAKDLKCAPDGVISFVSNLSFNGPGHYPTGFMAAAPGTCQLQDGDFKATIVITDLPTPSP